MMGQRGKDLLDSLLICFTFSVKLKMATLVIDGNLQRMKLDFAFVTLVSLNSDINLKAKNV